MEAKNLKGIFKKAVISSIMGLCLLTVLKGEGVADNVTLNARLVYSGSEKKSREKTIATTSLAQVYTVGFDKRVTNSINMQGDVRAINNRVNSKETTSFAPSLYLNMGNDYFSSNAGYQMNNRSLSSGDNMVTELKHISLSSAPSGFPTIRFSYDEEGTKDDPVRSTDIRQSNTNAGTSYSLYGVNMGYNFYKSESTDFIFQIKQENPTHQGTINYGKTFLNNTLNFNTNYGISKSESIHTSLSGTPKFFEETAEAEQGLYSMDNIPGIDQLVNAPTLIDGNRQSPATVSDTSDADKIDLNGLYRNIGVKLQGEEGITSLYVYIATAEQTIGEIPFGWIAYSSSDGNNWENPINLTSNNYNEINSRFEFVFSKVTALFFKVVNTNYDESATNIYVTEIEARASLTETRQDRVKTATERQYGGLTISLNPTEKMNTSYNIYIDKSEQSSDVSRIDSSSVNINQGISSSYNVSKHLSLSANYQNQRFDSGSGDDTGSNNYSISLYTNPITTINGSVSFNQVESLRKGQLSNKTDSGNFNINSVFYPGVNLATNFTLTQSKDISSGHETITNATGSNLTLRPRKSINIWFNGATSFSTTDTGEHKTSSTSDALSGTLSLNPSRHINLSAGLHFLPDEQQNYSINTRLPGSLQINLKYSRSHTGTETMGFLMSWKISRHMYVSTNYRLMETHDESDTSSRSYSISLSMQR